MSSQGVSFDGLSTVTIANLYALAEKKDDSVGAALREIRERWATSAGVCVVAGGFFRSLVMGEMPRDIDVVVLGSIPERFVEGAKKNVFGGYKLLVHGVSVDLWSVQDTWAVKEGFLPPTADGLIRSFFFNSEAVAIDPHDRHVTEAGFLYAVQKRTLEIMTTRPPFPPPSFQVMRAAVLCGKYGWNVGPELRAFINSANSDPKDVWSLHRRYYGKARVSLQFVEDFLTRP